MDKKYQQVGQEGGNSGNMESVQNDLVNALISEPHRK